MKPIVAILSLLTIGSIAVAATLTWRTLQPTWQVESDVRNRLKDPDSAKFSEVTFNKVKGAGCGYVNAKNSMGGYTGASHFILLKDGALHFAPSGSSTEGTLEQRIEYLKKEITYLQLVEDYCGKK